MTIDAAIKKRRETELEAMDLLYVNMTRMRNDMLLVTSPNPVPLSMVASMTVLELGIAAGHLDTARDRLARDIRELKRLLFEDAT